MSLRTRLIIFALDKKGSLFTPDEADRSRLQMLGVSRVGSLAATGSPRRIGDWVVVARRDLRGLVFGIARPIGESLREIRSMSFRNLSMRVLERIEASVRTFRGRAEPFDGATMMALRLDP